MRWPAAFLRGSARHRSPNSINSVTSMGVGPSRHAPMNWRTGIEAVWTAVREMGGELGGRHGGGPSRHAPTKCEGIRQGVERVAACGRGSVSAGNAAAHCKRRPAPPARCCGRAASSAAPPRAQTPRPAAAPPRGAAPAAGQGRAEHGRHRRVRALEFGHDELGGAAAERHAPHVQAATCKPLLSAAASVSVSTHIPRTQPPRTPVCCAAPALAAQLLFPAPTHPP